MKTLKIVTIALASVLLASCGGKTETKEIPTEEIQAQDINLAKLNLDNLLIEIKRREDNLAKDNTKMDRQKAQELIEAYIVFQDRFKNRDKSAEYLFKAGEMAMGLNMTSQAIKCFDKVYFEYTKYEKRPYALFMKAFVLENQAKNFVEAQKAYEEFLEEYPRHQMADDAEYSIKNMGKSPEELIREFEIQDSIRKANGEA